MPICQQKIVQVFVDSFVDRMDQLQHKEHFIAHKEQGDTKDVKLLVQAFIATTQLNSTQSWVGLIFLW